jgi:hypothetical protein
MWRLARSLEQLRAQVNHLCPRRSTKSDGTIGDPAHAATKSDHNPNADGVVTAIDITHDPTGGFSAGLLAETLRRNQDPRIKYVIWNKRIFSSMVEPWRWRPYSGANAHDKHVHVSVIGADMDSIREWRIT